MSYYYNQVTSYLRHLIIGFLVAKDKISFYAFDSIVAS
jgi:hypothetical protein